MTIAFLDVHYQGRGARAACVLAESWESESPAASFVQDIETVAAYEPGNFYRRELPCLLSVLSLLPAPPDMVVIDGYVWLSSADRPGLGARLYEALGPYETGLGTPVIGIAKTAFAGAESAACVLQVVRGGSQRPLFVTAIGIAPELAAQHVRGMAGKHRIPDLLRITDSLSRGRAAPGVHSA